MFSDDLGRGCRKPHPAPFRAALTQLGVRPESAAYVGDRPDKDVTGAVAAGLRAVRVTTGEYAGQPGPGTAWFSTASFAAAADRLARHLPDECAVSA